DRMVHQGHRRPGPGRQRSSRQERMNQTSDDRPQPLDERPEPVRVVVVGAGGMGRAWIRTVLGFPHAHLVGVADVLDGAAARAVEEEVPEARREAVATGIDAVTVAQQAGAEAIIDVTIPAAHHAVTSDALHAGLPVLGEKPCAATLAEAVSLAGHAETTGELFMVSQSRRHNPHLRETRRLADQLAERASSTRGSTGYLASEASARRWTIPSSWTWPSTPSTPAGC